MRYILTFTFLITFITSLLITFIAFCLFCFLNNLNYFKLFYKNKKLFQYVNELEIINTAGLDSTLYLKMINFSKYVYIFITVWTCSILLPIHLISKPITVTWDNYKKTDNLLWVHILSCWVISIFIMILLLIYNIQVRNLRLNYISNHPKKPEYHTVYISDIPVNTDILRECKIIYGDNSISDIVYSKNNSAFIIFQKRIPYIIATNMNNYRNQLKWITLSAPNPNEIIWKNIGITIWNRIYRKILVWILFIVLVIFYMVPITSVQTLIFSFSKKILFINLLPSILINIFITFLPYILTFMYKLTGIISKYDIDFGVVYMFFYFQIITLFLGTIITGSVLNNLKDFFINPLNIINIIVSNISSTSDFFINYIIISGIGMVGLNHIRIIPLLKFIIYKSIDAELWYSQYIPMYTILFLIGITYCCINPIIAPILLIYFSISFISEKYNHMYIYNKKHESGGHLWTCVFNQFIISLYIFQLIMILQFYSSYDKFLVLLPLPFITSIYHYINYMLFVPLWESLPLHDAAILDLHEQLLTDIEIQVIKTGYTEIIL